MPIYATLGPIRYYLPEKVLTNLELSDIFPEWTPTKIEEKTGIVERRIAGDNEYASDLACGAAARLFSETSIAPSDIDYLILCTQSSDYLLPTTACIVQHRLGLKTEIGAIDINLGCSGYIYGLGLAKALIESGSATNVLLLTSDTYSKYLNPMDKGVRTLFGDGGAATVVRMSKSDNDTPLIGPFVYGTDGSGADALIVRGGGMRDQLNKAGRYLHMSGPDVYSFTLKSVPACVSLLLEKSGLKIADISLFVFHQANGYMLEQLRRKIGIPADKFLVSMSHCGNTVSSSIPIAIRDAQVHGMFGEGSLVMLVGFGVGLSWGAVLVRWLDIQ